MTSKYDRILTEKLRKFLTTPSPNREFLVRYVLDNIKNGPRSVALCFRSNMATLYYRCHRLLCIRSSHDGIIGEFDFRHARFSKNYGQTLIRLNELHVDASSFSAESGRTARKYVRFNLERCAEVELKEILKIYRGLIDDFFDPEKTEYAFDVPLKNRVKTLYLEKDRQQQLWARYFLNDSLTYYDLEFSQRDGGLNGLHGRFDLIGLRTESDGYTLLLTELKSSPQATYGKSGIINHEKDYLNYLNSRFIGTRKKEACEAIRLLCEIFQRPYPKNLTPENIKDVKVKFVFSDKVIDVGMNYRPTDNRIEKAYLECGVEKSY